MKFVAPLKFRPIYQTRVWGGQRLKNILGRSYPDSLNPVGESWELSDRPEAQSVVVEGPAADLTLHDLWVNHRVEVFGQKLLHHPSPRYPLLLKVLDACDDLSIQVHPPASVAPSLGGEPKTEMWFIVHTEPDAKIYAGLQPHVTREAFVTALQNGTVAECVQALHPQAGEYLFIPSGRIHAIGAGLLIYEIQQNSDTTYRVFDWNRKGLDGRPRQLHVEESLQSIDFSDTQPVSQTAGADGSLAECEYFQTRLGNKGQETMGSDGESLTFAVVRGSFELCGQAFQAGEFALMPACIPLEYRRISAKQAEPVWLEIRIP